MPYIYNDEDNYPMNEDYIFRADLNYDESGQFYRDREAEEDAKREKMRNAVKGVLDMLGLEGGCRKCKHMTDPVEGFLRYNSLVSGEQMMYLRMICAGCHGKGTGAINPEHEKRLDKFWQERREWVNDHGLRCRCLYCPNVYRIYGEYKNPDDEWIAIEDYCGDCKYFE